MNGEKNETVSLRKAEIRDAQAIASFNVKMAAETEGKKLAPEVVLRGVKAVIKDPHKGFYLVAEIRKPEPCVVGQLMVTFEWSDWRNRNFWWIQSVYVETEHRGRGIFGQLFRHLEEMARWRKDVAGLRLYVEKHNQQAREIYESLGMVQTYYDMLEMEFG
jgi:ribosomal protein S18 acetylase RimI-like enzyme